MYLCSGSEPTRPPTGSERACQLEFTGSAGEARFSTPGSGTFSVTAELDGFAYTSVYPLNFGKHASPKSPTSLVITLNPVCFDC